MENEMELTIMRLITAAGDARSLAMQAIRAARAGHLDEADALMLSLIHISHRVRPDFQHLSVSLGKQLDYSRQRAWCLRRK